MRRWIRGRFEFIVKQLDRGSWWFLEDGVVLHTKAVEGFYLEEGADRTDFSRE